MKKLYELDASQEFGDESSATESGNISEGGVIAGDFEAVSGMGIGGSLEDDDAAEQSLAQMLAAINAKAGQDAEDFEREERERQAYLEEEERRAMDAKARFNKERYEKEQAALAERNERERILREEEERLAAEKAESSFLGKLQRKLSKKSKAEDEEPYIGDTSEEGANDCEDFDAQYEESANDEPAFEDMDLSGFISLDDTVDAKPQSNAKDGERQQKYDASLATDREDEDSSSQSESKGILSLFSRKKPSNSSSSHVNKEKKAAKKAAAPVRASKQNAVGDEEPDWKYIATHDDVTGLLNARAYKDDLNKQKNTLGVVFFYVNGLSSVVEEHGSVVSDRVVGEIAGVLSSVYGKERMYRTGSGEFVCIVPSPGKSFSDNCIQKSGKVHNAMIKATKEDPDGALHSVSIGYAQGDGDATVEDVVKVANYAMYQNKKAYERAHKNEEPQAPQSKGKAAGSAGKEPTHDELLSREQKELKERIKDGHSQVSRSFTANVMREIQRKSSEIEAIFIASPTFDHLFVVTDIDDFLDMMEENQALIDYSYLYVVYQGGTQYYGADEYYDKVTDLFRNVADALLRGRFRSEKDIQSIPGINIFKNVYV